MGEGGAGEAACVVMSDPRTRTNVATESAQAPSRRAPLAGDGVSHKFGPQVMGPEHANVEVPVCDCNKHYDASGMFHDARTGVDLVLVNDDPVFQHSFAQVVEEAYTKHARACEFPTVDKSSSGVRVKSAFVRALAPIDLLSGGMRAAGWRPFADVLKDGCNAVAGVPVSSNMICCLYLPGEMFGLHLDNRQDQHAPHGQPLNECDSNYAKNIRLCGQSRSILRTHRPGEMSYFIIGEQGRPGRFIAYRLCGTVLIVTPALLGDTSPHANPGAGHTRTHGAYT